MISSSSPRISVMVVEDDTADRILYRRLFARARSRYEVSEFTTASQALAMVPHIKPQCLLLDINLPDLSGLDVLERIQKLEASESTSVVMLTADETRGLGVRALKAGATDFIVKHDLDAETLKRAVHRAVAALRTRQIQAQLENAEKLAALGKLAAGVAHEVNNPATFVQTNLDVIAMRLHSTDERAPIELDAEASRELREMVADCRDGIRQISTIVGELRAQTLAGLEGVRFVVVDDVVGAVRRLLKAQLSAVALTEFCLGAPTPIPAERSRLIQVATNLILNAVQATGADGHIRVTTTTSGRTVLLDVEDNGPGISPAHRARIFEPFFTTKQGTKGMGLGLALCADYVHKHGGEIHVGESSLGGSLFRVRLPVENGLVCGTGPSTQLRAFLPRMAS